MEDPFSGAEYFEGAAVMTAMEAEVLEPVAAPGGGASGEPERCAAAGSDETPAKRQRVGGDDSVITPTRAVPVAGSTGSLTPASALALAQACRKAPPSARVCHGEGGGRRVSDGSRRRRGARG